MLAVEYPDAYFWNKTITYNYIFSLNLLEKIKLHQLESSYIFFPVSPKTHTVDGLGESPKVGGLMTFCSDQSNLYHIQLTIELCYFM